MLFNSAEFLFAFLPLTLLGFYVLGRWTGTRLALGFLVAASLFFYGYWKAEYLVLIVLSTLANFALGKVLAEPARAKESRRAFLAVGVTANLALLGYYKYSGFLLGTVAALSGAKVPDLHILLPLGISFFTFQQIAYLVDAYRGEAKELNLPRYALFVTFFPQLIAGPIVHHREVLPQFSRKGLFRFQSERIGVGLTLLVIGLFKKIILADGVAIYARPVFEAADGGLTVSALEAWGGALAYTFQLYFDFSGYSDMALGLGRLFGIRLPQNFNSPYRATSIVQFWQSWHITLSQFLRDYLYIPLGGNRRGKSRRYVNLMLTMLLGGLWHGAGWNFVIWGGLHGSYLIINHAFRARVAQPIWEKKPVLQVIPWALTFLAVVVAWVFFRATTYGGAWAMLRAMLLVDGLHLPAGYLRSLGALGQLAQACGVSFDLEKMPLFFGLPQLLWLGGLGAMCTLCPNSCELMKRYRPVTRLARGAHVPLLSFEFRLTPRWAVLVGAMGLVTLAYLQRVSEFLYFQF